jgi:hypothetical protein
VTAAISITVHVPPTIRRRGGRKLVMTPDGSGPGAAPALVKALARAHRWKRFLEEGRYGFLGNLAKAEKIDRSYLGEMLRLTLLAPIIVEAILDGRQPGQRRRLPPVGLDPVSGPAQDQILYCGSENAGTPRIRRGQPLDKCSSRGRDRAEPGELPIALLIRFEFALELRAPCPLLSIWGKVPITPLA